MANLQYIGARYVPIFYTNPDDGTASWKSGISYEALTIVVYNNDSYTSKKLVPDNIGNPASNPDYWVKTGDFNASLTALQNEVNDINDNLDDTMKIVDSTANNGLGNTQISVFCAKDPTYLHTVGDSSHHYLQGVAYDSLRKRLCYIVAGSSDTDILLIIVDYADRTTVYNTKLYNDGTIKHGADFCYNPTIDKYVIIGNSDAGTILYLDPLTLTVSNTLTPIGALVGNDRFAGVTYDAINDKYYIVSPNGIYIFDGAFNYESYPQIDIPNLVIDNVYVSGLSAYPPNGIAFYNGKIYCAFLYSVGSIVYNLILGFNVDGTLFTTFKFVNYHQMTEIEGMYAVNNELHAVSRWYAFNDSVLLTQKNVSFVNRYYSEQPIMLVAGADLDSYYNPITIKCEATAIAKTLLHCPTEYPFIMSVTQKSAYVCEQILKAAVGDGYITYRRKSTGGNWTAWTRIGIQLVSHNETFVARGIFSGYSTPTGFNIFIPDVYIPSDIVDADITVTIDGNFYTIDGKMAAAGSTASVAIRHANSGLVVNVVTPTAPTNERPMVHWGRVTFAVAPSV